MRRSKNKTNNSRTFEGQSRQGALGLRRLPDGAKGGRSRVALVQIRRAVPLVKRCRERGVRQDVARRGGAGKALPADAVHAVAPHHRPLGNRGRNEDCRHAKAHSRELGRARVGNEGRNDVVVGAPVFVKCHNEERALIQARIALQNVVDGLHQLVRQLRIVRRMKIGGVALVPRPIVFCRKNP